jgi:hypothetical protein
MAQATRSQKIAWMAVENAKVTLGEGWKHVSNEVRWGLVCANLLSVVASQNVVDERNGSEHEWANVGKFAVDLWRDAAAIQYTEWKKPWGPL